MQIEERNDVQRSESQSAPRATMVAMERLEGVLTAGPLLMVLYVRQLDVVPGACAEGVGLTPWYQVEPL